MHKLVNIEVIVLQLFQKNWRYQFIIQLSINRLFIVSCLADVAMWIGIFFSYGNIHLHN